MLQNPDVTVRFRGVMEKCTFCVQRINRARIEAKRDDRPVADGEVMTACQSACPSNAIIFGDMRKPENKVAASRASKRNYLMLEELNTRPRTTYLSRISNPNPELEGGH
jgi:molybdopterin-containing oxidoreductase family iron-sulfur binding subunit